MWRKPGFQANAPQVTLKPPPRAQSAGPSKPAGKGPPSSWDRAPRFGGYFPEAYNTGQRGFSFNPEARTGGSTSSTSSCCPPRPWKATARPESAGRHVPGSTSTWLNEDACSVSIPSMVSTALANVWRQATRQSSETRFLCVLETCQNCERHATTTKHDPKKYEGYCASVMEWMKQEFSFMEVRRLKFEQEQVRIGAFEVYLLIGRGGGCPEPLVVHSKLTSLKWPLRANLITRTEAAMPAIVAKVRAHNKENQTWNPKEAEALLEEVQEWGLAGWEPAAAVAERGKEVARCLDHGHKASTDGNSHALREAVHQGMQSGVSADVVLGWREALKGKNLMLFNLKVHARRLHRNAAFSAAVKGLAKAVVQPLRIAVLQRAIENARAAEVDEQDIEPVADLLDRCTACLETLKMGLQNKDMELIRQNFSMLDELSLRDTQVDEAENLVANLADEVAPATEMHDLLQLTDLLAGWTHIPAGNAIAEGTLWAIIASGEAERHRLQTLVDQAEQRFAEKRWDALQSRMDQLQDAQVDGEAWDRWTQALKRERSWVVIKAVSGTAPVLKSKLYTSRLQAALNAPSIHEDAFEKAISDCEQHVDKELLEQAKSELTSVRHRWQGANEAAERRLVDTAEVLVWKLQQSRILLKSSESKDLPLWRLAEAVHTADAAHDWEAMQQAIDGWKQEKPDSEHKAFHEESSPTKALRYAIQRIPELKAQDLRSKLDDAVDVAHLGSNEVKLIRTLAQQLKELGLEVPVAQRARILALHSAKQPSSRFGLALLRVVEAPSKVVVLLDQSKSVRADNFNQHVKPAAKKIAQDLRSLAEETKFGAVAYGPMKMLQALTKEMQDYATAVDGRKFGNGDRTTSKALRKALELFKVAATGDVEDEQRIVFNFTAGAPENLKDAEKTLKHLEASGVIVVGIGIGAAAPQEEVAKISSDGLAFHIDGFKNVLPFLDKAFASLQAVLQDAESKSAEEILSALAP